MSNLTLKARQDATYGVELSAVAHAYPRQVVDNEAYFQAARFQVTKDRPALIAETQMKTRYWCADDENTWTMARAAVQKLLEKHPGLAEEIDVAVVASGTTLAVLHPPDAENAGMQDLAPRVLAQMGRTDALGLDIKACYCTGFLRGLQVVDGLLASSNHQTALLVCTEMGSRYSVADTNRSSFAFLSGDAAGAVVLRKRAGQKDAGLLDYVGWTDGTKLDWVGVGPDGHSLVNKGSRVAEVVHKMFVDCGRALLSRNGLTMKDVTWLLPLQTHHKLVHAVRASLECPEEKLLWSGDVTGLSGSASIPSALSVALENQTVRKGDLILSVAVGAGLNCAGALYRV